MKKPDSERRLLNKKLLKSTFFSELKSNMASLKSKRAFKMFIDILTVFIALFLADIIAQKLNISFWLYGFLIYLVILLIITVIGKAIDAGLKKIQRKN